jgi:hypothetical protein
MKTLTHMQLLAVAALALGATQARAEAPSDTRERSASPLDSPRATGPDVRVAPEVTAPVDTTPAPSPLAMPPAPVVPLTANGAPSTALDTDRFPPPAPEPTNAPRYSSSYSPALSRVGAGVLLGGGYEDFTSSNVRDMTTGGGFWNARLVAGTRQIVGLEAAYVGSARGIDALGLAGDARLVSNGAEGAVRGNLPIAVGRSLLEPFVLVGLGWQHYSLTNTTTNTSDVADRDDVMTLPLGTGFEYSYGRFLADVRFMYHRTYFNDLMRTGGRLDNVSAGTQVGMSF